MLYLGKDTGKQVIVAGERGAVVDPETGELCFPAMVCNNPQCPARTSPDEPVLFIQPDPAYYVQPDGALGFDPRRAPKSWVIEGCPYCWQLRKPGETPAQKRQYLEWVQRYVLPETAAKQKLLDEEYKRRVEWEELNPARKTAR
jgi:hypothetical protein